MLSPDCCALATTTALGLALGRIASSSATNSGVVFGTDGAAGDGLAGGASATGTGAVCGAVDAGAVGAASEDAWDCCGAGGLMVDAGCVCPASFAGEPAMDAGWRIADADGSVFGAAALGWISAAGLFDGIVSGNEISGVAAAACLAAAPSSACFALAPSSPISTTMLRSSRKVRTSGAPLRVKTTATVSKSTSASMDFRVCGSEALASARSRIHLLVKLKVTWPSARSGTTLTVPGIVKI